MHGHTDLQLAISKRFNTYLRMCNSDVNIITISLFVVLSAPTNVQARVLTPNSVEVTWDQLPGFTDYLVSHTFPALNDGGQTVTVNVGDITSHTLTDLVESTPYDITVRGRTSNGRLGDKSTVISITTTAGK